MAQTLEEFLVSVKYAVDQPSQQRFFDGLKRAATSIGGVTAELTGLGVGLVELSKSLAQHGDALYWMSQRLGESIGSIQAASYAMANFGVSTSEAAAAMDKFGYWQRSMGPAATAYLRTLGVGARDADLQLEALGKRLLSFKSGSMEYAIELQRLGMMGIDERTARAAGMAAPYAAANERMQAQIWGVGAGGSRGDVRARVKEQTDAYGVASNQVIQQFNKMGLFFETLTQKFALGLFRAIGPDLVKLNDALLQMVPHFERLMAMVINYAPQVMSFLLGFIHAAGGFVELLTNTISWIEKLPPAMKQAAEAIVGMKIGFDILSSPIGRMILLFTTFMLLLDDYQQWKKNQETGSKVKTLLDWGGFDSIVQPLSKLGGQFDDWAKNLTGINNALEYITGGLMAGKIAGLIPKFGSVTDAVKTLSGALWAAGASATGLFALVGAVLAAVAVVNRMGQNKMESLTKGAGYEFHMGAFSNYYTKDGKKYSTEEVFKELGIDPKTGLTFGQSSGLKDLPKPPEGGYKAQPMPGDESKAPVTKSDSKTLGLLDRIGQWGEETAKGIAKLIELQPITDLGELIHNQLADNPAALAAARAAGITLGAPGTPFSGTEKEFYQQTYNDIYAAAKAAGLPNPEVVARLGAAQAAQETGYGKHQVGNNIFGIKAGAGVGSGSVTAMTHEVVGGQDQYIPQNFASFGSPKEAAEGYVKFLMSQPRYRGLIQAQTDADALSWLGQSHYATDPNYTNAVTGIENRWNSTPKPPRAAAAAGKQTSFNYQTNITVHSPDPHAAGQKVYAEQTRVFDYQTRHAQSRLA